MSKAIGRVELDNQLMLPGLKAAEPPERRLQP
jgi:hypothetical protein